MTMNDRPASLPHPPQPSPQMVPTSEVQAIVGELSWQRNMMSDRAANLAVQLGMIQGQLAERDERIKQLVAEVVEARAQLNQRLAAEGAPEPEPDFPLVDPPPTH